MFQHTPVDDKGKIPSGRGRPLLHMVGICDDNLDGGDAFTYLVIYIAYMSMWMKQFFY